MQRAQTSSRQPPKQIAALRNAVSGKNASGNFSGRGPNDELYDYLIPIVIGLGLTSLALTTWFLWPRSGSASSTDVASTRSAPIYDDLTDSSVVREPARPTPPQPLAPPVDDRDQQIRQQVRNVISNSDLTEPPARPSSDISLNTVPESYPEEGETDSSTRPTNQNAVPAPDNDTASNLRSLDDANIRSEQALVSTALDNGEPPLSTPTIPDTESAAAQTAANPSRDSSAEPEASATLDLESAVIDTAPQPDGSAAATQPGRLNASLIYDPSLDPEAGIQSTRTEPSTTSTDLVPSRGEAETSTTVEEEVDPAEAARTVVEATTDSQDGIKVARALPVDPDKLTTERVAAYQVALERMHFSCGFVDGDIGMRTRRVLRAFQSSRGLQVTGELDRATRAAIGEPGEPFTTYRVTEEDMAKIEPTPDTWKAKSKRKYLGYNDGWEMLAEKFHCTVQYLKDLNPDVRRIRRGTVVIGPKVFPALPIPKAAKFRIILREASMQALDERGRIIAHFPCSIARSKEKRPRGTLRVKNMAPNPNYTFRPSTFPDIAKEEGIDKTIILPPGPNNPVGTTWVGLNLPGYGMHGTPEPEHISATGSAGCFRLANWNAAKMIEMVHVGMEVQVVP